jgi:hypothetical protein
MGSFTKFISKPLADTRRWLMATLLPHALLFIFFAHVHEAKAQSNDSSNPSIESLNGKAEKRDEKADLKTGKISLDFLAGWSFGAVGQSIVAVPVFNNYVVNGTGAVAGGIGFGVAIKPSILFFANVAVLDGHHHTTSGVVVPGFDGLFAVQTYTRSVVYDADIEKMFCTRNHILGIKRFKFIPYFAGGVGTVQSRADVLDQYVPNPPVSAGDYPPAAWNGRGRAGAFALNSSLGARVFLRRSFGLRLEAKGYFPTGTVKAPFVRLSSGVFFTFR